MGEPDYFDNIRFIVYFAYGITYGLVVGLLNIQLDKLKNRNEWWRKWIILLELERKSVHVLSWAMFYFGHEIAPLSTMSLCMYWGFGASILGVLNIIRLNSTAARNWIERNMKGFLREDEKEQQNWPAIFSLFTAICIALLITRNKKIV